MNKIFDKLNRPIKDLRISVIDTCNYRCPYCMPSNEFNEAYQFLKPAERLNFDEIYRVAKVFAEFGVDKVRLTGGEPLLRKNLPELISKLRKIKNIKDIALTTNGQLLQKQLPQLIEAGLDRVNISLDSIDKNQYHQMSGYKGDLQTVLNAIEYAMDTKLKSIKLNCVIQEGVNDNQILPLLQKYKNTNIAVRFIEFMDVGNKNNWKQNKVLSSKEILQLIEKKWPLEAISPSYQGEVANRYKYKHYKGEIGFITSISKPFCGDCSRARLSADGKLYTCLFASESFDLKNHLRNQDDQFLKQYIQNVWQNRADRYSEIRGEVKNKNRKNKIEMYVIGG